MGHKLREEGPDTVHFVTNQTFQRRFFFKPDPKVNAIILACLAWAADKHDVRVFCYVFMSNHFHAMVQAVHMNCSDFMGSFKAELARRLNQLYGREGTLYAGRFKAEPVIGDEAMIERMRYILCNPVAAGLVETPGEWPGVTSWDAQMSDEEAVEGRFILKKEFRPLKRANPDLTLDQARKTYRLKLSRLPCWEDLDQESYRETLRELVGDHCEELVRHIEAEGRSILGAEDVKRQRWTRCATSRSTKRRPLCHTRSPKQRREYREHHREVRDRYSKASGTLYRRRNGPPEFPFGTYPPGRRRCEGAPPRHGRAA